MLSLVVRQPADEESSALFQALITSQQQGVSDFIIDC
jgi:hypothetical protein